MTTVYMEQGSHADSGEAYASRDAYLHTLAQRAVERLCSEATVSQPLGSAVLGSTPGLAPAEREA